MYSATQVEIFYNYVLIATHRRDRKAYGYTTNPDHLASTHRYLTEWNPDRFIKWGESVDLSVKVFITGLMDSKSHPEQAYKACQGVLGFERKVGRERLINVCRRAIEYENYSYGAIKSILENKYDMITYAEITADIPCSADRNQDPGQLLRFAECSFISKHENIIITGSTGIGKSYIATAIRHQVCTLGFKVCYANPGKLFSRFKMGKADGSYLKEISKIERQELLIIDDSGLLPIDSANRPALMEIVEDRH